MPQSRLHGNCPALPAPLPGVLSAPVWAELHDFLTLALDALGDGPADFTPDFLANAAMHQRTALRITSAAQRRTEGRA